MLFIMENCICVVGLISKGFVWYCWFFDIGLIRIEVKRVKVNVRESDIVVDFFFDEIEYKLWIVCSEIKYKYWL